MNSQYVQLSQVILMLDAQGGGKMTLLTQQGKKLTLSGHQLDINKLLINLPMLLITLCHALTSYVIDHQNVISNYGVDASIFKKCHHNTIHGKNDIYISFPPVCVPEVWDYNNANLKIFKKQYLILIGTGPLKNLSVDEKSFFFGTIFQTKRLNVIVVILVRLIKLDD